MERQIIAVVNQLIKKGKKPTVAMVKAKLTQHVAMPLLLKTLQKIESMTPAQVAKLAGEEAATVAASANSQNNELETLKKEVSELRNGLAQLKQQLNDFENLLKRTP